MKRSLSITLMLLLSFLAGACSNEGNMTEPVHLAAQATSSSEGLILVKGTTNLPDHTKLVISVSNDEVGFTAQAECSALNGRFSAGPIGPKGGLSPGNYVVRATMPIPSSQPDSVQLVTGKNGEHLTGPLVGESLVGAKVVRYSFSFPVGSEQAIAQSSKEHRETVAEVRSVIHRLLQNGQLMEQYRKTDDRSAMQACREMMQRNQAEAELLQKVTEKLSGKFYVALNPATIAVHSCVSCSEKALEACDRAADYLTWAE